MTKGCPSKFAIWENAREVKWDSELRSAGNYTMHVRDEQHCVGVATLAAFLFVVLSLTHSVQSSLPGQWQLPGFA